jgi:hypothetical protein
VDTAPPFLSPPLVMPLSLSFFYIIVHFISMMLLLPLA